MPLLIGLPVTFTLLFNSLASKFKNFLASSTANKTLSTFLERSFVVTPGYAFCSCVMVLIPIFTASFIIGPVT